MRVSESNRFRLIRKRMKRRMWERKRNASSSSPFSISISTLISTFTTTTITSNSIFNLNLTLFEPHPSPPFHSPRSPHSPLSSPYPLSPHSIPLVTSNFTSITFCYESKSPWPISVITSSISISFVMTNIINIIIMTSSISNANPKNLWSKFWSLTNSYTTSITSSISMTNSNC